jgi:hypothetical protein
VSDNKETSRTTKDIFGQKGEWILIIFGKRVFDITKIIQKIKNIELIYFPYYEPIMIHNRRHVISYGREQSFIQKTHDFPKYVTAVTAIAVTL